MDQNETLCIDTQMNDQTRAAAKAEREKERLNRWLSSRVLGESGCDVQSDWLVWKEKNTWFWDLAPLHLNFAELEKGPKGKATTPMLPRSVHLTISLYFFA